MSDKAVPPDDRARALREFQASESPRLRQLRRLIDQELERVDEAARNAARSSWREFFRRHHRPENNGELDFKGMAQMLSISLSVRGEEVSLPREAVELLCDVLDGQIKRPRHRPRDTFFVQSQKMIAVRQILNRENELNQQGVVGARSKTIKETADEAGKSFEAVRDWYYQITNLDKSAT